ncbi:MAG: SMC-Scp complex subunit ScpB [Phycisphaerae bacterium]|nr:SMC-Scp complex subunit ScpB [Phycisphaerae bacterium]
MIDLPSAETATQAPAGTEAPALPSVEPKPDATLAALAAPLCGPIEAVLITSGRAVSPHRLAVATGLEQPGPDDPAVAPAPTDSPAAPTARKRRSKASGPASADLIRAAIDQLNRQYEATGRAFRIEAVAGGFRLMTLPEFATAVKAYHGAGAAHRLSKAAIETLAIIAYKQPLTRAHIEAIRGVACGDLLKTLIDRKLVTIAGRAEELGRPLLYATSRQFLEAFGLASLKDLPTVTELGLRPPAAAGA